MSDIRMRAKYVSVIHASAVGAAERWRRQYQREDGRWTSTVSGGSDAIYDKLLALGKNPTIDEVAEVIGNKSWSYLRCDGCGEELQTLVNLGEYEPHSYCKICIDEAHAILSNVEK